MNRLRTLAPLVAALSVTTAAGFQGQAPNPSASPPTGLIIGRVVDGTTERPVGNVVVTLTTEVGSAPTPAPATPPKPQRVITDSAGRFLFANLEAGRYAFSVSGSAAWFGGGYGVRRPGGAAQPFELPDAGRATDVTLRVWKYASVSGTVTDDRGDPVIEAKVAVMKADFVAGRRRYGQRFEALTDDRGVYRISRLMPGDYVACLPFTQLTLPINRDPDSNTAAARRQLTNSGAMDSYATGFRIDDYILARVPTAYAAEGPVGPMFTTPPPVNGRVLVYPFQFYPNALRPSDATLLTLESGQERTGTDFQTRLVPSVRISGRVTGPNGPAPNLAVRLLPQALADTADERAMEIASTVTAANGVFTMLGVPAGAYVLKVSMVPTAPRPAPRPVMIMGPNGGVTSFSSIDTSQPPPPVPDDPALWATLGVNVADADVRDLNVVLRTGPRVLGRIAYDGIKAPLTEDQLVRVSVAFAPVDGRTGPSVSSYGQFDAKGMFTSAGILPGKYVVVVSGNLAGWSLKSATSGGRDVSDDPLLVESSDITDFVVTFTDRPSSLSGSVREANGTLDKNAVVLVFPADRSRWTDNGASPRRQRRLRTTVDGAFETSNLPSGDYLVVAVDDRMTMNWQDPRRLAQFASAATRVTLGDGERRSVSLATTIIR